MKISARYLDWAHEPPAESGVDASLRLCELADGKRGRIEVTDPDLLAEAYDVAELYEGNDAVALFYRAEAARITRDPEARAAYRAKVGR